MSNIMEWIKPCLIPLAGNPGGEDVRFDDEFEAVKQEIETLSGCDYDLILNNCHQLLCCKTKDLRIAGYFILALTQKYQLEGLLAGLFLYNALITEFGTTLHPQAVRARASSLAWLNSSRFKGLASTLHQPNPDEITKITTAVSTLNTTLRNAFANAVPPFTGLDEWITDHQQPLQQAINKNEPAEISKPQNNPVIDIEKQAPELQKKLIEFWRAEKKWLLACQLARAWRWSNPPPVSEMGKSSIPPPRKEGLQILERLKTRNDNEALLEHCEALFLEAGGAIFLDLQLDVYNAAVGLNDLKLAEYIKAHTTWYYHQHPVLFNASYADGSPFASPQTRQWLIEPALTEENPSPNFQTTLKEIAKKETSLASLLGSLQTLTPQTPLESLHLLQAKIQACMRLKKEKLAFIFYQDLLGLIESKCFADWQPLETMKIWREAMSFFRQVSSEILDKPQKSKLLNTLQSDMCRLNSEQACLWIE